MNFRNTLLFRVLQKAFTKDTPLPGEGPGTRPVSRILRNIILICLLLLVLGVTAGCFFNNSILSLLNWEASASSGIAVSLVKPVLFIFISLFMYSWGVIISYGGIAGFLMRSKTQGRIISCEISSSYDSDEGDIYMISCVVVYSVKGFEYQSEGTLDFYTASREEAREKLEGINQGDIIPVIFDPKDPYSMSLDKRPGHERGEITAGICFIIGGFLFSILFGALLGDFFGSLL